MVSIGTPLPLLMYFYMMLTCEINNTDNLQLSTFIHDHVSFVYGKLWVVRRYSQVYSINIY